METGYMAIEIKRLKSSTISIFVFINSGQNKFNWCKELFLIKTSIFNAHKLSLLKIMKAKWERTD